MEKRTLSRWKALAGGLVVGGLAGMLGCQTQPSINPARAEADRQNVPIYVTNPETGEVVRDVVMPFEVYDDFKDYINLPKAPLGKTPEFTDYNSYLLSIPWRFKAGNRMDRIEIKGYLKNPRVKPTSWEYRNPEPIGIIHFVGGNGPTREEFMGSEEWRTRYKWEYIIQTSLFDIEF